MAWGRLMTINCASRDAQHEPVSTIRTQPSIARCATSRLAAIHVSRGAAETPLEPASSGRHLRPQGRGLLRRPRLPFRLAAVVPALR